MASDEKIDEILEIVREERKLNNSRFTQLSATVMDLRKEVGGVKKEMSDTKAELKQEINKVYDCLSQDIQVFTEGLIKIKRRADKIERKIA